MQIRERKMQSNEYLNQALKVEIRFICSIHAEENTIEICSAIDHKKLA